MSHRYEVPGTTTGLIARMHAVRRGGGVRPHCARFLSLHCQQHRVFILHFVNARGLRIVKCPLRMKRTRSFVAIVSWEEQSLSVLSSVGKDSSFVVECVVCSFVVSSMVIVRSIRYTAENRFIRFRFVECLCWLRSCDRFAIQRIIESLLTCFIRSAFVECRWCAS